MKQILLLGGVLLISTLLVTPANAKVLRVFSNPSSIPSDLSERLAADKSFQGITMSVYHLTAVINRPEYFSLYKKYLQRIATSEEQISLLKVFGFSDDQELVSFMVKYYTNVREVYNKFPEIVQNENAKQEMSLAAVKVLETGGKAYKNPAQECWIGLLAMNTACLAFCGQFEGQYFNDCMWQCLSAALAVYGLCMGLA